MNDKSLRKIMKYVMIAMAVGVIVGIGVDELLRTQQTQPASTSEITTDTGFGKITLFDHGNQFGGAVFDSSVYLDDELGFMITKPSDAWNFDEDIDDILAQSSDKLLANGFLDGIYIESNGEKQIFLGVFDRQQIPEFSFESYIDSRISQIESQFVSELRAKNTQDNWGSFAIQFDTNGESKYGEELMQIHGNKLYMLQYVGDLPEILDDKKREEIRMIFDSFSLID